MSRRKIGVRIVAFAAVVVGCLMAGCSGPQGDPAKEPNRNLKAGPPNATPGELEIIRQHTHPQQPQQR